MWRRLDQETNSKLRGFRLPVINTIMGSAQVSRLSKKGKNFCSNCNKKLKLGDPAVILKKAKRKWYCQPCAIKLHIL
jgi:hypothetical protein